MNRRRTLEYATLGAGVLAGVASGVVRTVRPFGDAAVTDELSLGELLATALSLAAVVLTSYALYRLLLGALVRTGTRRRAHDVRNLLRFGFGIATAVALLGVATEQWLGLLVSLGVIGFAITFALQQPLLSVLAWVYIMLERPFSAGDRVRIGEAKGDVIEVDFLVTTIWEIHGELLSSNQPSGRVVTVPNSLVLSSEVINFGGGGSEFVWNELSFQVSYETDLAFAREIMIDEADALLGDEMAASVADFRERLAETPVELEVRDRPSVNAFQEESWIDLRLRYATHPRRGQQVKNELYERILARFNEQPDRVSFPVSRNR